ncbi:hypothetical protein, partial [Streptomyces calidiresistens]
ETTTGDEPEDTDGDHPEIELPDDVELVFDWDTPEDPDEAAALQNARNFIESIALGVVEQNPDHPLYKEYSHPTGNAGNHARDQISMWVDGEWTMHGTDRYYNPEFRTLDNGESLVIELCMDESGMGAKNATTGELYEGEEDPERENFLAYNLLMSPAVHDPDFWQVATAEMVRGADRCRE